MQCLQLAHTIVTMKRDTEQIKPVSVKRGWGYMRVCDSGHKKVSSVSIKWVNLRVNIWAFHWDERNCLLCMSVRVKWVSVERDSTVFVNVVENVCYENALVILNSADCYCKHHKHQCDCDSKRLLQDKWWSRDESDCEIPMLGDTLQYHNQGQYNENQGLLVLTFP